MAKYSPMNMSAVFTYVKKAIIAQFPKTRVVSSREANSPEFPCVQIYLTNKHRNTNSMTLAWDDEQYTVTYEVQIFSNKKTSPIKECDALVSVIESAFNELHYRLSFLQQIDNIDPSVMRFIARFEGIAVGGESITITT